MLALPKQEPASPFKLWLYSVYKCLNVFSSNILTMTYLKSWEEFQRAGERLYLQNPSKVRYVMKYIHKDGLLLVKLTDDVQCFQYKTEIVQDLNKIEKFITNLMKHMTSKENH